MRYRAGSCPVFSDNGEKIAKDNLLHPVIGINIEHIDRAEFIQRQVQKFRDQAAGQIQACTVYKRTQWERGGKRAGKQRPFSIKVKPADIGDPGGDAEQDKRQYATNTNERSVRGADSGGRSCRRTQQSRQADSNT